MNEVAVVRSRLKRTLVATANDFTKLDQLLAKKRRKILKDTKVVFGKVRLYGSPEEGWIMTQDYTIEAPE
jgi:hypothetical protein